MYFVLFKNTLIEYIKKNINTIRLLFVTTHLLLIINLDSFRIKKITMMLLALYYSV